MPQDLFDNAVRREWPLPCSISRWPAARPVTTRTHYNYSYSAFPFEHTGSFEFHASLDALGRWTAFAESVLGPAPTTAPVPWTASAATSMADGT